MDEKERLKERLRADMEKLEDPEAPRHSEAIAQHYANMGYDLSYVEIQALVQDIGREIGLNLA